MTRFRTVLIAMTVALALLTIAAIAQGGFDLLSPFVLPILAGTWQGQFNADFSCYLILSGLWMAWRGGFTRQSITLGLLAPPLGILFFAPYLLWLLGRCNGDIKRLLLGVHSAG